MQLPSWEINNGHDILTPQISGRVKKTADAPVRRFHQLHQGIRIKHRLPPKTALYFESFHTSMKGTMQLNGISLELFDIHSGVKQGCVVVPTPFRILFALLVIHAFGTATEGIYLRTRRTFLEIPETSRTYLDLYIYIFYLS